MRCIYCNTPLAAIDYCPGCGADITIQKRIVRISNLLYNEGLEKALVRDMEGAITCLKRSLKFYKENTDARNLLGLCYYETGEAVSALCEWVVSKNLQPEGNLADHYINLLQTNKNKLDTINQTIRKFNQSLIYCREDNEDVAIIQLKKVISQNPKLVKAYQLLALLYIKRQEYERARKLLRKAARIDATNTTTLRYLQEIEDITGKGSGRAARIKREEGSQEAEISGSLRYMSGTEMIIQPTTFRDSSTIATFINIILGIMLGGAIVWFMMVPANRQAVNDAANKLVTEANTKLATESVKVQELQDQIDGYADQTQKAEKERDDALSKADSYDKLLAIANVYIGGNSASAANMIAELKESDFTGNAEKLYQTLATAVQSNLFDQYYNDGTVAYVDGDYEKAAELLQKAVDTDTARTNPNHYNALLYMGMAHYNMGDTVKADKAFNLIIEYFPAQSSIVQGYISSGNSSQSTDQMAQNLSGLGSSTTGEYSGASANNTGTDYGTADYTGGDYGAADYTAPADGGIVISEDQGNQDVYYDDTYVAWTDPVTGLNYDAYGNLIG